MSNTRKRSSDCGESASAISDRDAATVLHRVVIVAFLLAAYASSFEGQFLFDDYDRILDEPAVRHVLPLSDHFGTRRPLVSLSLAVNYAFGGFSVWGYHGFNLLVHALAALTLYALLRRTLIVSSRLKWSRQAAGAFAFAVTLLWAVHPLLTQGVTYIIQRGESMASLFYLLTLYCVVRLVAGRSIAMWGAFAILACACAMACKAMAVTLPVVAILLDGVLLTENRQHVLRRWWLYLGLAATWGVLVTSGVARGMFASGEPGNRATVGFGVGSISSWEYATSQPEVILHYLRLVFWPYPLVLDYDWPVETNASLIVLTAGVLVVLLGAAIWCLRRWPGVSVAGLGFFLILSPTSSIVPIRDLAFEHRMYLPLACVLVVVVAIVRRGLIAMQERGRLGRPLTRGVGVVLLFVAAICLTIVTSERNRDYADPLAMWRSVAEHRPGNSRAYANIACFLMRRGELKGAETAIREALRLRDDFTDAYVSLGDILKQQGRFNEAKEAFLCALQDKRDSAAARTSLIPFLMAEGRVQDALEYGRKAVQLRPNMVEAHANYAIALEQSGDAEKALAEYREAVRLNPDAYQAQFRMGLLLLKANRLKDAEAAFREVLRVVPEEAEANYMLGIALAKQGRVEEALAAFRATLRIDPSHAGAKRQLALSPQ